MSAFVRASTRSPILSLTRQTVGRRSASTNPDAIQHFENTYVRPACPLPSSSSWALALRLAGYRG